MFWAKLCLGPYAINSVGKVVLNVTALMLCFRALSLLNISVQTSLQYHGLNIYCLQQAQALTLRVLPCS